MADLSPPPPVTEAAPLRLVLFGLPNAGKSSLLGALGQAAEAQEHLLQGRLEDPMLGLADQRRRLYDEAPRRTAEEVVPYPLVFHALGGAAPVHAVFIDCDGRVANDLIVRRKSLDEGSPEGTLAREVLDADVLLLAVDAAAPEAEQQADFEEFGRFLRLMERGRGERAEVGGLPVFLVLTKCDLLAQKNDTPADWLERIEQRKREVDAHFRAFLAHPPGGPLPAFGRLDLHQWATAVKRPALQGVPARPRDPFGVAELFRQGLELAATFRASRRSAARRLVWTAFLAGGVVLLMLLVGGALLLTGLLHRQTELERRVEALRFGDAPTAATRLQAPLDLLQQRLEQFQEVRNAPGFRGLDAKSRAFVEERVAELEAYFALLARLEPLRPAEARTEKELEQVAQAIQAAAPPEDWAGTDADKLFEQRMGEVKALQDALKAAREWYQTKAKEARDLWVFDAPPADFRWIDWARRAKALVDPPPEPPKDLTTVLTYPEVIREREPWDKTRERLQSVYDLALALGLADAESLGLEGLSARKVGVLAFDSEFQLRDAAVRLDRLKEAFPDYSMRFRRDRVEDAVWRLVRPLVEERYSPALFAPAQALVLRKLQQAGSGPEETAARWQQVRDWLADPPPLRDWRDLGATFARLRGLPEPVDPVDALRDFLGKTSFALNVRRLQLVLPDDAGLRLSPGAELKVFYPPAVANGPAWVFRWDGETVADAAGHARRFVFNRVEGRELNYAPGERFAPELRLAGDQQLTWERSRSARYQFERLQQPPRLHRIGEGPLTGELRRDVRVEVIGPPGEQLPRVPELLPQVRLE
jgi:hypothetical protein